MPIEVLVHLDARLAIAATLLIRQQLQTLLGETDGIVCRHRAWILGVCGWEGQKRGGGTEPFWATGEKRSFFIRNKLFRSRKSRTIGSAQLAFQKEPEQMRAETRNV